MTAIIEQERLTREAARALTDEIKVRVTDLLPLIREAFQRRADKALGYETWADYCRAELSDIRVPVVDRPDAVAELNELGMSQRQIGDALGISNATVSRHLRPSVTSVTDGDRSPSSEPAEDIVLAEDEEHPLPGMPEGQKLAEIIATGIDKFIDEQPPAKPESVQPQPDPDALARFKLEQEERQSKEVFSKNLVQSVWYLAEFGGVVDAPERAIRNWQPSQDSLPFKTTAERMRRAADYLYALAERWPQ